jgi:hypothetical protein
MFHDPSNPRNPNFSQKRSQDFIDAIAAGGDYKEGVTSSELGATVMSHSALAAGVRRACPMGKHLPGAQAAPRQHQSEDDTYHARANLGDEHLFDRLPGQMDRCRAGCHGLFPAGEQQHGPQRLGLGEPPQYLMQPLPGTKDQFRLKRRTLLQRDVPVNGKARQAVGLPEEEARLRRLVQSIYP